MAGNPRPPARPAAAPHLLLLLGLRAPRVGGALLGGLVGGSLAPGPLRLPLSLCQRLLLGSQSHVLKQPRQGGRVGDSEGPTPAPLELEVDLGIALCDSCRPAAVVQWAGHKLWREDCSLVGIVRT